MTQTNENSSKSSDEKQKEGCSSARDCCGNTDKDENCSKNSNGSAKKGIFAGIIYGLIPHVGCIAFLIAAVLGATAATTFFKPLLMSPYFFYILIVLSLVFATIYAMIYLSRCGCLSLDGAKKRWKYLATLYSTTIIVNLLLFMVIFPLVAANLYSGQSNTQLNAAPHGSDAISSSVAGNTNIGTGDSTITLQVNIPCPGHAPLISEELKKLDGVNSIDYNFPNTFKVAYDSSKLSKAQILGIDVFKSYPATVLEENYINPYNN